MNFLFKILIPFFICLNFISCVTQPINPETIYRKDMRLKIDGKDLNGGVYVLEKKPSYEIKAYFFKDADKFVATSCHRHVVWSNPGGDVKFEYDPDPDIEQNDDELCPLELGAFDVKGQHSWAYLDFRSDENLSGRLSCNGGLTLPVHGVSVCQSKVNLIQRIAFDVPVSWVGSRGCPIPETHDNKIFIIATGRGKCFYLFQSGKDFHRLTMFGYDDVILR